jgi:hypothetical protein
MDVDRVAAAGKGKAVLMNLSPQWYNAYRQSSYKDVAKRDVFMKHVAAKPFVKLVNGGEKEFGHEFVFWDKGDRRIMFLVQNPAITVTELGGGNAVGLKSETIPVTLEFAQALEKARDERTGKDLANGTQFAVDWKMNEAVVISFQRPK